MTKRMKREETTQIIHLYRDHECLWDISSPLYKRQDVKQSAFESIGRQMGITPEQVKTRIKNLRNTYVVERKKVLQCLKADNGTVELYEPTLFWYGEMEFLNPIITLRKTIPTPETPVPYKEEIEEDVEEAYIKWESETPEPSCSQASDGSCSEIQESVSAPQPSGIPNDPPNHNTTFTEVVEMKSDPGDMYDVWLKSLTLQVKELAKISPFRAYDAIYKFQSYVADNMLAVMKEKEGHLQPSCSTSFLNQKS